REVLRLLDEDLGPYRDRAEALVREHLEKAVGGVPYREQGEPAAAEATRACAECGTANDPDAKFCKECAHRFEPESAADAEADDGQEEPGADSEDESSDEAPRAAS